MLLTSLARLVPGSSRVAAFSLSRIPSSLRRLSTHRRWPNTVWNHLARRPPLLRSSPPFSSSTEKNIHAKKGDEEPEVVGGEARIKGRPSREGKASANQTNDALGKDGQTSSALLADDVTAAGDGTQREDIASESSASGRIWGADVRWPARTHGCGELRASDDDTEDSEDGSSAVEVTLCGWVDRHRDLGGIIFLDVRDHTGIVQVVIDPQEAQPELVDIAEKLRSEWVITVTGTVRRRKDPNPKLATGAIEIAARDVRVLNQVTRPLPFAISTSEDAPRSAKSSQSKASPHEGPREELRLRHRVLDLRRPAMASNLRLRHAVVRSTRRYLEDDHGFVEIETPILTKSTPEGARDYLVPSRIQVGDWYALPQSPQLFKQMLMIAGYDRYYQVRNQACGLHALSLLLSQIFLFVSAPPLI